MHKLYQFTYKQQYYRIGYLAICFLFMFSSFNSLQSMISKLYDQYGYTNLGQTSLLFIYFFGMLGNLLSSYIVKKVGYIKILFMSSLGYVLFETTGLLIVTDIQINDKLVWVIVNLGAAICGFSASCLWISQAAYTSTVASQNRKTQMFSLFWGFMMSSQIFGNLISMFVLGKINNFTYFVVLIAVGTLSAVLFLNLPHVQIKQTSEHLHLKIQLQKIWQIIKDQKCKYLNLYFLFPGLAIAFPAGFLYIIIKVTVPQQYNQSLNDYNMRLSYFQGLMFIGLGVSQIITGFVMNRFTQKFSKFKMAILGIVIAQIAATASLMSYHLASFDLCFISALLWGIAQCFLQINTGALISTVLPGKVQAYTVNNLFFSIGVIFVLLLNIIFTKYTPYVYLFTIIIIVSVGIFISLRLKQLQKSIKQYSQLVEIKIVQKVQQFKTSLQQDDQQK